MATAATGVPVAGTRMIAGATVRAGCPLAVVTGVLVDPGAAVWRGVAVTASETARPTAVARLEGEMMTVRDVADLCCNAAWL